MSDNKELNENELNEDKINKLLFNISDEEEVKTEELNEEEKNKSKAEKWIKGIIMVLLLTAVTAFAVITIFFSKKSYTGYEVAAETAKNLPEGSDYVTDYGKILCYNDEGITIFNGKGEIEWNAALNMTNPKITVNNGCAVIADIGGRNLLVVNHKNIPAKQVSLQMLQDILLVDISEQGEIAVLMEADKGYNIQLINPYDKNNSLKAEIKTYSKDDGYALSLAMSKDGSKLVTEYVKTDNNEIKSTLTFYNFDKIGENSNADRIVGVFPFEDTIFSKLKFADNNTVCAFGDNKIACFEAKREPVLLWEKKVAGKIERVAEDKSGFALLVNESNIAMADNTGSVSGAAVSSDYIDGDYLTGKAVESDKSVLYSFGYSGSKNFAKEADINAKGMSFNNGETVLYSENNCIVFDENGNQKFKNKFNDGIMGFFPTDNKVKYYTVLGKKLKIIKLNE